MSRYPKNPEAVSRFSPEQYRVTRRDGTERPFDNAYWDNKEPGIYVDVVSGEPLSLRSISSTAALVGRASPSPSSPKT
jgi:peptide methionine sulfoxide reductase MsrB